MTGVRVLVFAEIGAGEEDAFEGAFAEVAARMKGTPGHIRDELLRDVRDPRSYVVVGEWTSREEFQAWFDDPGHPQTTAPMNRYWAGSARHGIWDVPVRVSRDGGGGSTARAMVVIDLDPAEGERFESTFADVSKKVRGTPGLQANILLRSSSEAGAYIVVSEWDSKASFLAWEDEPSHRELTKPLQAFWSGAGTRRGLYEVAVTTDAAPQASAR